MHRREAIKLFGSVAAAISPLAAYAQQPMPVIGFLGLTSFDEWKRYVEAFHKGLGEAGFVAGRNVAMEYRWAEGHYDQLQPMAADLVTRNVSAIVTVAPPATLAAKTATQTIPVVFFMGSDPVKLGLIASFNRPGGNVTGVTVLANAIGVKRLQLLHEIVPRSRISGFLVNPTNQNADPDIKEMLAAADSLQQTLVVAKATTEAEIDEAFATFKQKNAGGLVVNPDPFLLGRRERIASLAQRDRIATIFHTYEPVLAGGLMSYGANFPEGHRQVGLYVARILKGEKPADLPVPQAATFETVINLKTARALGLTIPPSLLATADEVIE